MRNSTIPSVIVGTVDKILFESDDGDFRVFIVRGNDRHEHKCKGITLPLEVGDYVRCSGEHRSDSYGQYFQCLVVLTETPDTHEGMKRFLMSPRFPGIGEKAATGLISTFGTRLFDVIENEPSKLKLAPHFSLSKVDTLVKQYKEHKQQCDALCFLIGHGVGPSNAQKIVKRFGNEAVARVQKNPYALDSFDGIGFKTCDAIASKLGLELDCPHRIKSGLNFVLKEAAGNGHTSLYCDDVLSSATSLLRLDTTCIESVLNDLIDDESLIPFVDGEHVSVALPKLFNYESVIAKNLVRIAKSFTARQAMRVPKQWLSSLSAAQQDGVKVAFNNGVMILTGLPGTGKTTTCRAIIETFEDNGLSVALCAPTGRAAARLSETSGADASTIYRLLKYKPQLARFELDSNNPLQADVILADEFSMSDAFQSASLVQAIKSGAQLIIVGDPHQLASVGAGNVLADIIDSDLFPTIKLTEVFRQAATSKIIQAAHSVVNGKMPVITNEANDDLFFISCDDGQDAVEKINGLISKRLTSYYGFDSQNIQILTPTHNGATGTVNLNQNLQKVLVPAGDSLQIGEAHFRVGDRVMQTTNDDDRDIYNGEIGSIVRIDKKNKSAIVDFDGRKLKYEKEHLRDLEHSFAITIHKSQGSEFECVIVPLFMSNYHMLDRSLVYVAMTRAKKILVLVGERRALAAAISESRQVRRQTSLLWQLKRMFLKGTSSTLASTESLAEAS